MSDILETGTLTSERIVVSSGEKEITGLDFENIITADNGGAVNCSVNALGLSVSESSFTGNQATGNKDGGAIYAGSAVDIQNSDFVENYASNRGGAIALAGSPGSIRSISDSNFTSNRAATSGGAIRAAYGNLAVSGSIFTANIAENGQGGAILLNAVSTGTHTISNSYFDSNQAKGTESKGGAIYISTTVNKVLTAGTVKITGATFTGNIAASGGALYNDFGNVTLSGSTFLTASDTIYNNSTLTVKGEMVLAADLITSENGTTTVQDAALTFINSESITVSNFTVDGTVSLNFAGSAVVNFTDQSLADVAAITVENPVYGVVATGVKDAPALYTFKNNSTAALKYDAGAKTLYVARGVILAKDADGTGNTYAGFAAAQAADSAKIEYISCQSGTHTIENFVVSGNKISGTDQGGAIWSSQNAGLNLKNSLISDCSAYRAGGLFVGNNWTVTGSTFSGNTATDQGGAMRCANTIKQTGSLSNSLFIGNSAGTDGGAIRLYCSSATISGTTFSGNEAGVNGGALVMNDPQAAYNVTVTNALFTGNRAANGGAIALTVTQGNVTISGSTFATATDTIHNLGTVKFSGSITLNASLTGTGTWTVADGTNFTIGKGVDLNGVDFSKASITVDGALYSTDTLIATGVGSADTGKFSVVNNPFMTLTLDGTKLWLKEIAGEEITETGTYKGDGFTIMSSGKVTNFIGKEVTGSETEIATKVSGGTITQNLVGGAYAKFAEDGKAEIGNVELNFSGEANVEASARVYAGGYLYGVDKAEAPDAAQMTVEKVTVNLDSDGVAGNVYGGAHARQNGNASVTEVNITVTGNNELTRIYAGGWAEGGAISHVETSNVTVKGSAKVDYLYGGGANGSGSTSVGTTNITITDSAEVGTIFMAGRYGYSSVGAVNLTFDGEAKTLKRLSGVSSAGIDHTENAVVTLETSLTANSIDYVDKFIINENCTLTAVDAFLLGDRDPLEATTQDNVTTFAINAGESSWDVVAGLSSEDFANARFAIGNEIKAWGEGNSTLAFDGCILTRTETEKDKFTISIAKA